MFALLQDVPASTLPGGYGIALLQTLLALGAVCVLAWVVLRWAARRGVGVGPSRGRIRVIERIPLDPRRALYLVKVGDRILLVGAGEGGAPALLTEVDPSELPPAKAPSRGKGFADVLRRLGHKDES